MKPDAGDSKLSAETAGWLARLLVVRSCGHLEKVVQACARGYVEFKSGGPTQSFALSWTERSRNPSEANLLELLTRFESGWAEELLELLSANDELLHRELAWAIDTRNRIAHGENQGAGPEKALVSCASMELLADWWVDRLSPAKS